MDIKVVDIKNNKLLNNETSNVNHKLMIEKCFESAFGLRIVKKDYQLSSSVHEIVEYLCLDEANRIVIVETKAGKNQRVIKNGLFVIDYIRENISMIKMLMNDIFGVSISKEIDYNPRLVILCDSFNEYDYKSILNLPYNIEVINYHITNNLIVFVKQFQNIKMDFSYHVGFNHILDYIFDYLLSLGDEVSISSNNKIYVVRKIKAFLYIYITNDLIYVILNNTRYQILKIDDFKNIEKLIEKTYDEF